MSTKGSQIEISHCGSKGRLLFSFRGPVCFFQGGGVERMVDHRASRSQGHDAAAAWMRFWSFLRLETQKTPQPAGRF